MSRSCIAATTVHVSQLPRKALEAPVSVLLATGPCKGCAFVRPLCACRPGLTPTSLCHFVVSKIHPPPTSLEVRPNPEYYLVSRGLRGSPFYLVNLPKKTPWWDSQDGAPRGQQTVQTPIYVTVKPTLLSPSNPCVQGHVPVHSS